MPYPTETTQTRIVGLREICTVDGHHFKRLKGTQVWTEYTPPTDTIRFSTTTPDTSTNTMEHNAEPLYLSIIHESQSASEPTHWSLYVAHENQPGNIYQVTGDAEHMTYDPSRELVDITTSEAFKTAYQIAEITDEQADVVRRVADEEKPPSAVNRRAVRENCQGWCVRVLGRLRDMSVVADGKVEMARGMMEPI